MLFDLITAACWVALLTGLAIAGIAEVVKAIRRHLPHRKPRAH